MGIGSLTEAFGNGLGRVTENQKIADAGQQIARTIDETAAYGRQKAPRASAAGGLAGNLALYGGLAQGVGAIPGLANLSPLARSVGTGALTLVGGTAVQEVGEASTTGDWERFARDTGISTLAGGVGGAAAYGANALGRGALSDLGLQDSKLLNIANRSWSAGMFGLAAGDTRETARALTEEGYEPDWNGVARDAKALALLGAVEGLLDSASISQREKVRTQENIKDVQEWYKAARDTLVDPNATPEQRSILAQRAINHADWARLQLDEIRSPGAQREIGEAQRALDGISEELRPWAAEKAGLLSAPQHDLSPQIPQMSTASEFEAMRNAGLLRLPTFDKFAGMKYDDTVEYRNLLARYQNLMGQREWSAVEFNPETVDRHFESHGSAFGFSTAEEYGRAAIDFINSEVNKLSFTDANGITRYYSEDTGVFAAVYPDGTVATLFKPRTGIKYWESQVKKYGEQ